MPVDTSTHHSTSSLVKEDVMHIEVSTTQEDHPPPPSTPRGISQSSSTTTTSSSSSSQPSSSQQLATITYPDGGLRAWLTVLACTTVCLTAFGQVTAFGIFQTYYAENQLSHLSPSEISWIGGVQILLIYLSGIVLGRVFDLYGARGMLLSGCLLSVFSLMMLSLCKTYYEIFLSQGVGLGLGIALQFYPLVVVPAHWFKLKRAIALGIVVSGSSLGGVIFPILLSRLFPKLGFGWTVRVMAFVVLVLQGVSIPWIRERHGLRAAQREKKSVENLNVQEEGGVVSETEKEKEESGGRKSTSMSAESTMTGTTVTTLSVPIKEEKSQKSKSTSSLSLSTSSLMDWLVIDWKAFQDRKFMWHALSGFFTSFGLYTPFWYIELYLLQLNGSSPSSSSMSNGLAFYIIAIMNAAGVFGRIGSGWVADMFGKFNTLVPVAFMQSLSCLVLWTTSRGTAESVVFAIIFGFTSASYSTLASACVAQITPDPRRIGARTGMFMVSMAPGILAGPPIAGAILSRTSSSGNGGVGGYVPMQVFTGVVLLLGAICAVMARLRCEKSVLAKV